MTDFAGRLESVKQRLQSACDRSGRATDEVKLLAVSKTRGPDIVREAAEHGIRSFGENKVQEAEQKIPLCPGNLDWHLVGHLQSNKIKKAVRLFDTIHSVDSLKLLEGIDKACEEAGRHITVMLEVNVAGEAGKFGMRPEDVTPALEAAAALKRVHIAGLMTMPPFRDDPSETRPWFKMLAEIRDAARESGYDIPELSMGMSHDLEIAVEEGATWIRIGTALFGARQ